MDGVVKQGGIDVTQSSLKCARADNPAKLPIPHEASVRLRRVRELAVVPAAAAAAAVIISNNSSSSGGVNTLE
jgi:hypothetical protein